MFRSLISRNINWTNIALSAMHWCHLHAYTRRSNSLHIIHKSLTHLLVILVGHQSTADLGISFAWQHSLATLARIAAPYTTNIKGWTARVAFQCGIALFTKSGIHIYCLTISILRERYLRYHLALRLWNRQHIVIETGDGDASLIIYHSREHLCQGIYRVLHRTAKMSTMQVAIRTSHLHLPIRQSTKTRSDRRSLLADHRSVTNKNYIAS